MASANPKDLVREFKTSKAGDVMTLLVKPEFFPAWTSDEMTTSLTGFMTSRSQGLP